MVNAAIIGYGKMGKMIENLAKQQGVNVVSTIDTHSDDSKFKEINAESLEGTDVCIDFTHPTVAIDNARKIAELGKNIVMGTTGWYGQMDEMQKIAEDNNIAIIWSGNFSIGVNMFFRIVRAAAKIANKIEGFDPFVYELHHNQKADSPSGTAEMIGKIMIEELDNKDSLVVDKLDRKIEKNELHVASVRGGSIPGTHTVGFDSTSETIELKCTSRNREGFAMGSLMAAKWIDGKKGFFNIDDMMNDVIGGQK